MHEGVQKGVHEKLGDMDHGIDQAHQRIEEIHTMFQGVADGLLGQDFDSLRSLRSHHELAQELKDHHGCLGTLMDTMEKTITAKVSLPRSPPCLPACRNPCYLLCAHLAAACGWRRMLTPCWTNMKDVRMVVLSTLVVTLIGWALSLTRVSSRALRRVAVDQRLKLGDATYRGS
jgi:hypothetical protein